MRSFSLALLLATASFVPVQAQEADVSVEARDESFPEPRARQAQERPVDVAQRGDGGGRGERGGRGGGWRGNADGGAQAFPSQPQPEAQPQPQFQPEAQPQPQFQPRPEGDRMMRGVMGNDGGGNWRRRDGGGAAAPQETPAPQAAPQGFPQGGGVRNWGGRGDGGNGSDWSGRNRGDGQTRSDGNGWRRGDNGGAASPPPAAQPNPTRTWDRGDGGNGRVNRTWDQNRDGSRDRRWDRSDNRSVDRRWDQNRNGAWDHRGDRNDNGSFDRRWDQDRDGRFDRDRGSNRNGWSSNSRRWDRNWRNQNDYDWRGYRNQYRSLYRAPSYYSPYGYSGGYGYRRFSIGIYLESLFYSNRYWINDPWQYRLPDAYGPYRWVRYYNDVLLIDIRSGQVSDVIYDFFW